MNDDKKSVQHERLIEEIKAKQRNTVWPDTLMNGRSVDEFLWKGSPDAPLVQRMGAWIFGLAFMLIAVGVIAAGLALVVFGTVSKTPSLGVAGFVVMLGAAAFAMQSHRRAQNPDLRVVGGTATRTAKQRRNSIVDRLAERWRQRPEGHR